MREEMLCPHCRQPMRHRRFGVWFGLSRIDLGVWVSKPALDAPGGAR